MLVSLKHYGYSAYTADSANRRHIGPANQQSLRQIILANLIFCLFKIGKSKPTNETLLSHFRRYLSCGWTMHHTPGMNRKIRGRRLISKPWLDHRVSVSSSVENWIGVE
jgi:hypothetical protein